MSIWRTISVGQQPRLRLTNWRIVSTESSELHLVGYAIENHEGRVSSCIVEFDKDARIAKTRSGRLYELVGESGHHSDAEYVLSAWVRLNGVTELTDVTRKMLGE